MFLKKEKTRYAIKRGSGTPWRWSVTRRMVFSYTLSASVMLVVTAIFLNWTLHASLLKNEKDYLDDRLSVYQALIEKNSDFMNQIRTDVEWEGIHVAFPEYYVRVLDEQCRTLVETPRMAQLLPSQRFPDPCLIGNAAPKQFGPARHVVTQSGNGRTYLLENYRIETAHSSGHTVIQIAKDITSQNGIMEANQQRMLIIVVLGMVFALLFSMALGRRVLSPLSELTGFARRITIDSMRMRDTDPLHWPIELRALAVAFNEMLERLKNSFTRLSEYTSNLAHELRTPIHVLMGEAEIALAQDRSVQEYRKVLESGLEEHTRLARMIDSLLFLARADHPVDLKEQSRFDPVEEIEKVCSFFEALAEEKQARLSWSGSGGLHGDQILFRRVMSNLVSNALYYSPVGVTIDISVRERGDGFLEIRVNDTGYGLSEEEISHVFDRFYRVMERRSCNPQGSGLGLSIVKSIVELYSGTINLQSAPGQGTTVTLLFPSRNNTEQRSNGENQNL